MNTNTASDTTNPAVHWVRMRRYYQNYPYAERNYAEEQRCYLEATRELARLPLELVSEAERIVDAF
jgi:hypothetical protein